MWKPDSHLGASNYLDDFSAEFSHLQQDFRKLESGQTFAEPGSSSWEAFIAGHWTQSLALMDNIQESARTYFDGLRSSGKTHSRLRLVDRVPSDYLIWEMHALVRNARMGETISVLGLGVARGLSPSPSWIDDFVAIDDRVVYRVLYGEDGVNTGAERTTDPRVASEFIDVFTLLWANSVPLQAYFEANMQSVVPTNAID